MLLAIDTSTDTASLALAQDKTVLAELTWRSKQNHTTQLLPNLNYLFGITGTDVKSLTGIIIAQGPGSFNGLRVGVSAAKGLAFSLEIPIVGINSLAMAAYQYAETGLPVSAAAPGEAAAVEPAPAVVAGALGGGAAWEPHAHRPTTTLPSKSMTNGQR